MLKSTCCCSVAQLYLTLCDLMDCSTPGLSVPYHLPKFAQVHVRCIGEAIQPSHPLMPSSPSALNLSLSGTFPMSRLFTSDDQNTGTSASASVLPTSIRGCFPLRLTGLISLLAKGLSRVFSNITVQKHQFLCIQLSLYCNWIHCKWIIVH